MEKVYEDEDIRVVRLSNNTEYVIERKGRDALGEKHWVKWCTISKANARMEGVFAVGFISPELVFKLLRVIENLQIIDSMEKETGCSVCGGHIGLSE